MANEIIINNYIYYILIHSTEHNTITMASYYAIFVGVVRVAVVGVVVVVVAVVECIFTTGAWIPKRCTKLWKL